MTFKKVQKKAKKREKNLTELRDERTVPVAQDILAVIGAFDGPLGQVDQAKLAEAYDPLIKQVLAILLNNDVKLTEVQYIMTLVEQRLKHVESYVNASLNQNVSAALAIKWGKDESELTFSEIEAVLTENKEAK